LRVLVPVLRLTPPVTITPPLQPRPTPLRLRAAAPLPFRAFPLVRPLVATPARGFAFSYALVPRLSLPPPEAADPRRCGAPRSHLSPRSWPGSRWLPGLPTGSLLSLAAGLVGRRASHGCWPWWLPLSFLIVPAVFRGLSAHLSRLTALFLPLGCCPRRPRRCFRLSLHPTRAADRERSSPHGFSSCFLVGPRAVAVHRLSAFFPLARLVARTPSLFRSARPSAPAPLCAALRPTWRDLTHFRPLPPW